MSQLIKKTSLFPAFPSFFDDFFTKDMFDWGDKNFAGSGATLPSVNMKETEKEYCIELAAPGMKKDDFKVELDNNILSISSEREDEKVEKDDKGKYLRKEFNYHAFSRTFTMPENIKDDDVVAKYNDGILTVAIAKKEPTKKLKTKAIQVK